MTILLVLWTLIQTATVLGVANYLRHLPSERLIEGPAGVVVIAGVRGPWLEAEAFVEAMLDQDGVAPRLILAISGETDAAWLTLARLRDRHPDRIDIVVAGTSTVEGQKIHKLRAAVATLRPEDRYLVFVDTDYRPPRRLIGRLMFPLVRGKATIATGYRLLLPTSTAPALTLVAAIDLQVATLPRPPQGTIPWGGAVAMTRDVFEALGIDQAWAGRLSDDLTVARLARASGVGVRPVRDLLIASPLSGTAAEAFAFAIRQYRHLYWNVPSLWLWAAAIVTLHLAGWGFAFAFGWQAIAIGYAAGWLRAALRVAIIARVLNTSERRAMLGPLAWDCLLPSIVPVAHAVCVFAAPLSRWIRWGTYDYRMARGGAVERVEAR